MSLLDKLEQRFSRFAVPRLTLILIVGQILVFAPAIVTEMRLAGQPERPPNPVIERLELVPERVLEGEVWRLMTFVFVPPLDPLFVLFTWYFLWLMGTALEAEWGNFRYNLYLLVGYLATVGASFLLLLHPHPHPVTNAYLLGSIFLAFAWLYPDFEIRLFFILPVKIKWLALLTWLGFGFMFSLGLLTRDWGECLSVLAAVANFVLFFHRELWEKIKQGHRRMTRQAQGLAAERRPRYFHKCVVCGLTDRDDPDMDFRYCSKCVGSCGYCADHLNNHDHITEERPAARPEK